MKATKVITQLQELIEEHGDLPVRYLGDNDVDDVVWYDKDGDNQSEAVEFYLF